MPVVTSRPTTEPNDVICELLIRLAVSPMQLRGIHLEHREWLDERLAQPFAGRSVVITHHAPHPAAHAKLGVL